MNVAGQGWSIGEAGEAQTSGANYDAPASTKKLYYVLLHNGRVRIFDEFGNRGRAVSLTGWSRDRVDQTRTFMNWYYKFTPNY